MAELGAHVAPLRRLVAQARRLLRHRQSRVLLGRRALAGRAPPPGHHGAAQRARGDRTRGAQSRWPAWTTAAPAISTRRTAATRRRAGRRAAGRGSEGPAGPPAAQRRRGRAPASTCSSPATPTAGSSGRGTTSCGSSSRSRPGCTGSASRGSTSAAAPATGARPCASGAPSEITEISAALPSDSYTEAGHRLTRLRLGRAKNCLYGTCRIPFLPPHRRSLARHGLRIRGYNGRDVDPRLGRLEPGRYPQIRALHAAGATQRAWHDECLFPNSHDVYMHDTTQKHFFANSVRAESHGCMRVQNPDKLAQLILSRDQGWDASRVASCRTRQ